ncbi:MULTISPECIES: hypothetical protein [Rhodococcus]|uniref:Uncharacterized protein n=1 Tax=Rhodococcus rhodochrous J45 TaxID=935266 RepID=A0A562ENL2_RHORH|nr:MULTISPECIES: hypothetical protein [Rhodococcus]OWY79749.1 hypothetical protein B9C99_21375 [Rhodococcus sp. BUPNP1]TWH23495.1 hypothetical protein L618_001200000420 [Rhodococcus rhodochrous J45]BDB61000.1 hypothetical protein RDE2_27940 [Rhodococcus sp. RDE2]
MTRSEPNPLPPLGESLGLDLMDRIPELPGSVWCRVLDIATDPLTPRIGTELVPAEGIDEDDIEHPVIDDLPIEHLGDLDLTDTSDPEIVVDTTDPDF